MNECKSEGSPRASPSWGYSPKGGPDCAFYQGPSTGLSPRARLDPLGPLPSVPHPAPALKPDPRSLDIPRPDVQLPLATSRLTARATVRPPPPPATDPAETRSLGHRKSAGGSNLRARPRLAVRGVRTSKSALQSLGAVPLTGGMKPQG